MNDMERMTSRIVNEALDILRAEAEERETADRLRYLCDDAAEAAQWMRIKVRAMQDSPEMPAVGWDQWTRPLG